MLVPVPVPPLVPFVPRHSPVAFLSPLACFPFRLGRTRAAHLSSPLGIAEGLGSEIVNSIRKLREGICTEAHGKNIRMCPMCASDTLSIVMERHSYARH